MGGRGSGGDRNSHLSIINDHKMHRIDYADGFLKYVTYPEENNLFIDELHVKREARNKGVGTQMLEDIKKVAKNVGMTVELTALPFDKSSMSVDELIRWYEKRGFVHQGANRMLYTPKRRKR